MIMHKSNKMPPNGIDIHLEELDYKPDSGEFGPIGSLLIVSSPKLSTGVLFPDFINGASDPWEITDPVSGPQAEIK